MSTTSYAAGFYFCRCGIMWFSGLLAGAGSQKHPAAADTVPEQQTALETPAKDVKPLRKLI